MDTNLLEQGLTVLCVGFSVVFIFLSIMIVAMNIMSSVVGYLNKIFPTVSPSSVSVKKTLSSAQDEEIAVAIAAVCSNQY